MKKGINYVRANISLDQETVDMLHKLAEDWKFSNSSSVVRRAIKEFFDKYHNGGTE